MNFETVSLLMNWLELGALFAILSRLGRTFDLIASTQRELRPSITSASITALNLAPTTRSGDQRSRRFPLLHMRVAIRAAR